jgi:VWFA-related protein
MARHPAGISQLFCLALAGVLQSAAQVPSQPPAQRASSPNVAIDVVVAGRDARATDILGPQDFAVLVDGQPRRVLAVRHVSRGPGAASAAASRRSSGGGGAFGAEPSRTVLVVIDETMLRRGDERSVIQAAGAFLDRLGLEDRVAIVRLPLSSTTPVAFTTERPVTREALRAVAGQATASGIAAAEKGNPTDVDRAAAMDPDRASADRTLNRAEQVAPRDFAAALPEEDQERARATLTGLLSLFKALHPVVGRKVVALFSAGIPGTSQSPRTPLDSLVSAAAASRTVVYAFGLRPVQPDDRQPADFSSIEALAKGTGGMLAMVDKDPGRTMERVVPDLSACYVLSIESLGTDSDLRPRPMRVETSRKGFTVRAPAFLVVRNDPEDATVATEPVADEQTVSTANRARPDSRAASREADLQLALSRLTEYVESYQREFSAVVAEEDYVQTLPFDVQSAAERTITRQVRLRSDFLLVRPENSNAWVSFRDVFEVDGKPVRDRDERLKRLFLDNPTAEALVRVQAVQDESARYNVGRVQRNINVPLFALRVLRLENRPRFHFTLAGKGDSRGVPTWRIEGEERIRPTLVKNPKTGRDVPLRCWFLMDPETGAIVETGLDASDVDVTAHFVVRYRQDPLLGLWVPAQMEETYSAIPGRAEVMRGRATYSNFRRFQVKTEEKITIPK